MLIPSQELREFLHNPLSAVYTISSLKELLLQTRNILTVSVGDYVTKMYTDILGVPPHLAFIDGKTRRGERGREWIESVKEKYSEIYTIRNPRGTVNVFLIRETLAEIPITLSFGERVLVIVEGEEDLVVLYVPLLLEGIHEYRIIYGQPGMGTVVIDNPSLLSYVFSRLHPWMRLSIPLLPRRS